MRILAHFICGVLLCVGALAKDDDSHAQTRPVTLVSGLGDLHQPGFHQKSSGATN